MSQRRMFSQRITNSARFLKMSPSAQNLYFHLGMKADDDGVVEAYPVMQILGSVEDDFKILVVKGFIKPLNEDAVSFIIDWQEHNLIRADRKVNSIYKDLLMKIVPEVELIEPKPRADTGVIPRQVNTGRPVDGISKVRLGEVRLGEVSDIEVCPREEAEEFFNNESYRNSIIDKIVEKYSSNKEIIKKEVDKFTSYWTEKNKSGTKQKWELQETFEVKKRLAYWLNKDNPQFSKTNKSKITSI